MIRVWVLGDFTEFLTRDPGAAWEPRIVLGCVCGRVAIPQPQGPASSYSVFHAAWLLLCAMRDSCFKGPIKAELRRVIFQERVRPS